MKKIIIAGLLFSTSVALFSGEAKAETVGEAATSGAVEFSQNTKPVEPVDPTDPTKPIQPNQPPTDGPLSMSYVSDLYFGLNKMVSTEQTYYADATVVTRTDGTSLEVPNFVQVSDLSGSGKGWNLYCQFDQPLTSESGHTIAGAELRFSNIHFVSNDGVKQSIPSITEQRVVKSDAQSSATLIASPNKAHGSWNISFGRNTTEGKHSVSLLIPAKAVTSAGSYTTSLTWTMSSEK